jgi:glycosyltransferase involved in cell wall biosynthesis
MEEELVVVADRIVVAGDNLAERIRRLGKGSTVITHGIDLAHWTTSPLPSPIFENVERPIVLFWGLIDGRLDVNALKALSRIMTAGTIVLVGPEQDPDPILTKVSRLRKLGSVAYKCLPAIAAAADVLIMPYHDLPVTRAMQPLKLKEYLSTGKPVVVTRLPAVESWKDCLDIGESPDEFASFVQKRVMTGLPVPQSVARERLQQEDWREKARVLRTVLFED